MAKSGYERLRSLLYIIAGYCKVFFGNPHHVHGEQKQLERFCQLEMRNQDDGVKAILNEHPDLYDVVLTKTESCRKER